MKVNKNCTKTYDLWETNIKTGKKKPNYLPSALPKVELPCAGASYNPSLKGYMKYVTNLAAEESKKLAMEKRDRKMFKLSSEEAILPPAFKEDQSYFYNCDTKLEVKEERIVYEIKEEGDPVSPENIVLDTIKEEPVEIIETVKRTILKPKQKTFRQKRRQALKKTEEKNRSCITKKKLISHQLEKYFYSILWYKSFSLTAINREVKKNTEENAKMVQEKRNKRRIKKLTNRKKLGRGQYEKFMEPALLTTELSGSLVKLPVHCDILAERMNSFQKRNFIPITGERPKKLKMKLKLKNVEKRDVKSIKKGSRVL